MKQYYVMFTLKGKSHSYEFSTDTLAFAMQVAQILSAGANYTLVTL